MTVSSASCPKLCTSPAVFEIYRMLGERQEAELIREAERLALDPRCRAVGVAQEAGMDREHSRRLSATSARVVHRNASGAASFDLVQPGR